MINTRNKKSQFTTVTERLRPNWKIELQNLKNTMAKQPAPDIYGVTTRLSIFLQGCATDIKQMKIIEGNVLTLKQLVDSDHEFQQYTFVYRQLRILEKTVLLQLQTIPLAKQNLVYIDRRLTEASIPRTEALSNMVNQVPALEILGKDLLHSIRVVLKDLREMAIFYDIEPYMYDPKLSSEYTAAEGSTHAEVPLMFGNRTRCRQWCRQFARRFTTCCRNGRCLRPLGAIQSRLSLQSNQR